MALDDPAEKTLYATRLVPYRSLSPRACWLFIICFSLTTCLLSVPLYMAGAWPAAGFMGLDALGLYIAFRVNLHAARAREILKVTPVELVFAKISARGQRVEWRFNPCWVRLEREVHAEFGMERLALVSRGESVEVGSFLGPRQKAKLAEELAKALANARRGACFS